MSSTKWFPAKAWAKNSGGGEPAAHSVSFGLSAQNVPSANSSWPALTNIFAAANAIAEATSPVSASSLTALVSADINCIIPCCALNPPFSLWSKPKFWIESFSCTEAASEKVLINSDIGGSSCATPSVGASCQFASINSWTTSSATAISATASVNTWTDSVISPGAPAATSSVWANSILSVSPSVNTAFAAISAVKSLVPSAKFSWVSALQV